MCQCSFISCNKPTVLGLGDGRAMLSVGRGAEGIKELAGLSTQFYCEPKTALKNKICFLNNFFKIQRLVNI